MGDIDPRILLRAVVVAVCYFVAAKLGGALSFPNAPVSALWAPNAILLAALVLAPPRQWWLYLLAVLPLHFYAQLPNEPLLRVIAQYLANCTEAWLGAVALLRYAPEPWRFDRLRTMTVLIVLAALVAPFVTSVLMAAVFVAGNLTEDFWLLIVARTITNTFAILTLVPLIVRANAAIRHKPSASVPRVWEACALAVVLLALETFVFVLAIPELRHSPVLLYAQLPVLLWAAVRFGVTGACLSVLALGAIATWGVLNGRGPFVVSAPVHNALSLVFFLVVASIPLLLLAALLAERRETTRALAATNQNYRRILSEVRDAESARRECEFLRGAVLASLQDQIAVLNREGLITEANDSWRHFAQRSAIRPFERVLAGENYVDACLRAAARGDRFAWEMQESLRAVLEDAEPRRNLECSIPSADGTCWFEVSIERLRLPEGGAVITRTDVTQRKQTELQVLEKSRQVSQLSRAAVLGELSGAFAHELNQPLTSILGNAEAALQLLTRGPADLSEIRSILQDIVDDNMRASEVLQRLRALLVRGETQKQSVDLNMIVHEVLGIAKGDLISRNISAMTQLDPKLPRIFADRVEMQQVVLNLTINGCEAMMSVPPANRTLTLATRYLQSKGTVELSVADRGPGIAADNIDRVFQPFVTTKKHGMGLGLAICRSIVEAHNGRIWAENAEDGGAVFRVNMPVGGEVS
jgi:two-component system, LuxR family, sensor kinase FixL